MEQVDTQRNRLAGTALVAGGVLSIAGYVITGVLYGSDEDTRFDHAGFTPLYCIALAGAILTVVGLPAILAAHEGRQGRVLLVGYVGTLVALLMLNVGEGVVEAFIKPYLVDHGGIPEHTPDSLSIYFGVAFLAVLVGLISLGIAVIRAGVFPTWVGALIIAAVPLSFVGQALPGPLVELADYCLFVALIAVGWRVANPAADRQFVTPEAENWQEAAPANR